jgi:hypothetical protein
MGGWIMKLQRRRSLISLSLFAVLSAIFVLSATVRNSEHRSSDYLRDAVLGSQVLPKLDQSKPSLCPPF